MAIPPVTTSPPAIAIVISAAVQQDPELMKRVTALFFKPREPGDPVNITVRMEVSEGDSTAS